MKKDRNSFFQEYGMNAYNTNMPMQSMGMNQFPGGQQVQSNSSFYAGPVMPTMNDNYTNELESRLSKIERQINRLEARINRLEGDTSINYNNHNNSIDDTNYSNSSMYMV